MHVTHARGEEPMGAFRGRALCLCNPASLATEPGKWAPGRPHRKGTTDEALPRAQQGPSEPARQQRQGLSL